nr:hypothetical protein [Tanacetum cinerariifolium]
MLIQHPAEVGEDKTIHEKRGDKVERVSTTAASLDAEQDSGTINRTQSMAIPNQPIPKGTGSGEITHLKKRVKRLEKKRKSRILQLKRRLFKVMIESSTKKSLGDQEDTSNQGRNDQDKGISFVLEDAEIQGRYGHDTKINNASTSISTASTSISTAIINTTTAEPVTTVGAPITTAGVSVIAAEPSTPPTTTPTVIKDEDLIIAQTLMKMRSEKSKEKAKEKGLKEKSSETATRPTRGVIMREASETTTRPTVPPQQKLDPKNKEVEERLARQKEEDANIALIVEWDDFQAMMDANHELAERLQAEEQGELTIEERSKLFVELMNERKKYFARLRAEEKMRKPPTKVQKRNQMCTYLKNMAGFTHYQLKNKRFEEVQKAFDNTMSWINSFVDSEVVKDRAKGSETRAEGSSKRAGEIVSNDEVAIDAVPLATKPPIIVDWKIIKEGKISSYHFIRADGSSKRDENVKIISDDEIVIDAIPLATKPPIIVDRKIIKEGKIGSYHIIRHDESSKRYSSMIQMLQNINREDLETLWKLVKAKYGNTRPEEAYERVLWRDLKMLQNINREDLETLWKLVKAKK